MKVTSIMKESKVQCPEENYTKDYSGKEERRMPECVNSRMQDSCFDLFKHLIEKEHRPLCPNAIDILFNNYIKNCSFKTKFPSLY